MVLPDSDRISRAPSYSGTHRESQPFRIRGFHPLWPTFPVSFRYGCVFSTPIRCALQPRLHHCNRFGLFPVRSPLLRESHLISVPLGTEMVQFPRFHFLRLCVQRRIAGHDSGWVTPFGNLRIARCVLLPAAFRSLPRPSSSDSSRASTVNSYSLDHISPTLLATRPLALGLARCVRLRTLHATPSRDASSRIGTHTAQFSTRFVSLRLSFPCVCQRTLMKPASRASFCSIRILPKLHCVQSLRRIAATGYRIHTATRNPRMDAARRAYQCTTDDESTCSIQSWARLDSN